MRPAVCRVSEKQPYPDCAECRATSQEYTASIFVSEYAVGDLSASLAS